MLPPLAGSATARQSLPTLFYPLVLASMLSCALVVLRFQLMETRGYGHMLWNLFLAWIPYLCGRWTCRVHARNPSKPSSVLLPAALWLAWLPNASYLLTEFVHLQHVPTRAVWYDIALILAFAWTGTLLAVASLSMIHDIVRARLGEPAGWLFVLLVALLNGVGIYLGRFERWNTWDLLLNPLGVLLDTLTRVIHPFDHPRFAGITLFYAAFLLVTYVSLAGRGSRLPPPRKHR